MTEHPPNTRAVILFMQACEVSKNTSAITKMLASTYERYQQREYTLPEEVIAVCEDILHSAKDIERLKLAIIRANSKYAYVHSLSDTEETLT